MHLRAERRRRQGFGWRRLAVVGGLALAAVGGASLAPHLEQVPPTESPAVPSTAAVPVVRSLAFAPVANAAAPAPLAIPAIQPAVALAAPVVHPDAALLASVRADLAAKWVETDAETPLRSGTDDRAVTFTMLPQWTTLRGSASTKNGFMEVFYRGDDATRQPGTGWVKVADLGPIDTPSVWLSTTGQSTLWSTAIGASAGRETLPTGTQLEIVPGATSLTDIRIQVRLPGNGRTVAPAAGWVDATGLQRMSPPSAAQLPSAYPLDVAADLRLPVKYRTQLDGTPYAEANCGPTVLGMVLEGLGVNLSPGDLRSQVMVAQGGDPGDQEDGSFVWALADVAQVHGAHTFGLYQSDGQSLRQWSTDDVRNQLSQGRAVVLQVRYRWLPGREQSLYYGDHFIVVTGLVGTNFLYDDPIGGPSAREVPGFDRLMSAAQLQHAMNASDTDYAYSGFAIGS